MCVCVQNSTVSQASGAKRKRVELTWEAPRNTNYREIYFRCREWTLAVLFSQARSFLLLYFILPLVSESLRGVSKTSPVILSQTITAGSDCNTGWLSVSHISRSACCCAHSASVVQDYTTFWTQLNSSTLRLDSSWNSAAGVSNLLTD